MNPFQYVLVFDRFLRGHQRQILVMTEKPLNRKKKANVNDLLFNKKKKTKILKSSS
jgi:hypothetical protein